MYEESERKELKLELNDSVKKEIIGFLNSFGGTIYIGVNDKGEPKPITDSKKETLWIQL